MPKHVPSSPAPGRRSGRSKPAPSHSNSVSSNSSKAERNTRSVPKQTSPQSLSSEELSEQQAAEEAPTRRSQRQQQEAEDDEVAQIEEDPDSDSEVTRCICGNLEYQGLPVDATAGHGRKGSQAVKLDLDTQSDDAGGLFIQCDDCGVWQHGGCVGLMEQSAVPENYYCEQCKPEFHELFTSNNGTKYSHYLPVVEKYPLKTSHRKSSVAKDTEPKASKEKGKMSASAIQDAFTKRRSTMNSRAAYDEDEVLRKVLEESKTEGSVGADNGSRRGKRTRDDSEDVRSNIKRQRTTSSAISSGHSDAGSSAIESDGEELGDKAASKARGAARKSQREREAREKEKERAEAANKRKARIERRRIDGSEPLEDAPTRQSSNSKLSPSADHRDSPLPSQATTSKRGGRGGGRGGRGRGGYGAAKYGKLGSPKDPTEPQGSGGETSNSGPSKGISNGVPTKRGRQRKDEQLNNDSDKDSPDGNNHTAEGGHSSDPSRPTTGGVGESNGNGIHHSAKGEASHSTTKKDKDPSMNELKRRAAAMLEYMAMAQAELPTVPESDSSTSTLAPQRPEITKPSLLAIEAERLKGRLEKWQLDFA